MTLAAGTRLLKADGRRLLRDGGAAAIADGTAAGEKCCCESGGEPCRDCDQGSMATLNVYGFGPLPDNACDLLLTPAGGCLSIELPVCDVDGDLDEGCSAIYRLQFKVSGVWQELYRWTYGPGGCWTYPYRVSVDGGATWSDSYLTPWDYDHRSDHPTYPLVPGQLAEYRWTVQRRSGCLATDPQTVSRLVCDEPAAPTLAATKNGSHQIDLSWSDESTGDGDPDTEFFPDSGGDLYAILKSANGGSTWTVDGYSDTTSYSATGLAANHAYQFKVRGINMSLSYSYMEYCWFGPFSNTASATTDP